MPEGDCYSGGACPRQHLKEDLLVRSTISLRARLCDEAKMNLGAC